MPNKPIHARLYWWLSKKTERPAGYSEHSTLHFEKAAKITIDIASIIPQEKQNGGEEDRQANSYIKNEADKSIEENASKTIEQNASK